MNSHTPIWIIRDTIQNSVWHLIRRGRFTAPTADLSARPGDTLLGANYELSYTHLDHP